MNLQTAQNKLIRLADELGKGGEAAVYLVADQPDVVAKLYHRPTAERAIKIRAMIQKPPMQPDDHVSLAWPTELLYQRGRFSGFMMPKVEGAESIFHFYNPRLRESRYPHFSWPMMHRLAINLVTVMQAIHDKGHVVGDINESNILVTYQVMNPVKSVLFDFARLFTRQAESYFLDNPLITFVDTDSFQVRDAHGVIHRSLVAKPEYTPPELQGAVLPKTDQTIAHDLFGLGVLLFQMLMGGFHPFAGVLHTGESVGRVDLYNIRQGVFPYQPNKHAAPPPAAPSFKRLYPELQKLFIRCFVAGHQKPAQRPTAHEWRVALVEAEKLLTTCWEGHIYSSHLAECPWCEVKPISRVLNLPVPISQQPPKPPAKKTPRLSLLSPIFIVSASANEHQAGQALSDKIALAAEGATLALEARTYRLPDTLLIDKNLTLVGKGTDKTKIVGFERKTVVRINDATLEARGITFEGTKLPCDWTVMAVEDSQISLMKCAFREGRHGLRLMGSTTGDVIACVFVNNRVGLMCGGTSSLAIRHNIFRLNDTGVDIFDQVTPTLIENVLKKNFLGIRIRGEATPTLIENMCNNNDEGGIHYEDTSRGIARNNKITANGFFCIKVADSASPTLTKNSQMPKPTIVISPDGHQAGQVLFDKIMAAPAEATIALKAGRYQLPDTLILNKGVTLIGKGKDKTKLVGPSGKAVVEVNGAMFKARDITFEGGDVPQHKSVVEIRDSEITIVNCRFHQGYWGVVLRGKATGTIRYCVIEHNQSNGLSLCDQVSVDLIQNICQFNGHAGIFHHASLGESVFEQNRCIENKRGITVYCGKPTLLRNICIGNLLVGIAYASLGSGIAKENICCDNGRDDIMLVDKATPLLEDNIVGLINGAGSGGYDAEG